jgi:shikimate kinase
MSVILLGFRGCGKTTIGKRLADRLWQKCIDTDDLVTKSAGKSIAQIFQQDGEARFRELEAEAVKEACAMQEVVIALGGGAVVPEENRTLLMSSGHKRLFLKCEPRELLRRIESDPQSSDTRPPLTPGGGGIEEIQRLLAEREPFYKQVMTAELDVTNLSPQDAVVYLVRLM